MHPSRTSKDDKGDLSITKNSDLPSLLHDAIPSLGIGHLPVV